MGGGDSFPGFPVQNPTVSYWQLPPHRIAEHRTTQHLPTSTVWDYVIVGSGISGAAIAYKLLSRNASLKVLMLEARTAASGASGRNGGHCRAGFWLNIKKYVEAFGEDESLKFERLEEENVQDMADFVREHHVDCDFRDVETADLYTVEEEWAKVMEIVRFRDEIRQRRPDAGPLTQRKIWCGQEARDKMEIPTIVGAVTYPAHTQNPYRLVCKMLELSLKMGLNLQTNTPATMVSSVTNSNILAKWEVQTERGTVQAQRVVLATNGYTNAISPSLARTHFLTPGRNQCCAIRPGRRALNIPALRGSAGNDDFDKGSYFMCRQPGLEGENDIIFGGGRGVSKSMELGITDDSVVHPGIADYLHSMPSRFFSRDLWGEDGDVLRDWTGIVSYTPDTFPLVGAAPGEDGLWMSVAMNAHGMGVAFRCAEALVHMMTTGSEPSWFPTPLRLERAWKSERIDLRA